MQRNGRSGGALVRNKHGALLKGLLRCVPCDCSMGHSYSQQGSKRYRYYVCLNAQKRGWRQCPSKSVPAGEIERFVVDQIRGIGRDPAVLRETLRQARQQATKQLADLKTEQRGLVREMARHDAALRKLASVGTGNGQTAAALADLHERVRVAGRRAAELRGLIAALDGERVDEREVESALASFEPVWAALSPREQARVVRLLVERVDYDGDKGSVSITFRPSGIRALAEEQRELEEAAA